MRVLSRKLWRAFPELDQYDDEVCQRYLARARATNGNQYDPFLILIAVIAAFAFSIWISSSHHWFLRWIAAFITNRKQPGAMLETFIDLFVFVSGIWMPYVAGFLARDRLLHRSLKKHLGGAICPNCRYSLVGLGLHGPEGAKRVTCPECGHEAALTILNLTEADINPELA